MTDIEHNSSGLRLRKFRTSLGITQKSMAIILDIDSPYLTQIEKGVKSISSSIIEKITLSYPSLSLDWLLAGRGEMLISSRLSAVTPVSGPSTRVLHLPNLAAWAGDVVNIDMGLSEVEEWRIPRLGIMGGDLLYSFTARGDSMEPTIRAGDLLLCDAPMTNLADIEYNALYVVVFAGGVRVKRLRREGKSVSLVSDNSNYMPFTIEEGQFSALRVRLRISDVRDFF